MRDLYVELAPEAGRLAYLLVGEQNAAQDIAQEAFVRIAPRLAWLRDPDKAKAYLRKTVINLCRAHWSRRGRERPQEEMGAWLPGRPDHGPAIDQHDEMLVALRKLPIQQRAAVVLRYYEDLTEHQTADVLGCAVGTVKSSVSRALATLRSEFGRERDG